MNLERMRAAIAVAESNSGRNNYPRIEVAYCPKGLRMTVQGRRADRHGGLLERHGGRAVGPLGYVVGVQLQQLADSVPHRRRPGIRRAAVRAVVGRVLPAVGGQDLQRLLERGADTPALMADAWNTR